jgi:hypothetical protein
MDINEQRKTDKWIKIEVSPKRLVNNGLCGKIENVQFTIEKMKKQIDIMENKLNNWEQWKIYSIWTKNRFEKKIVETIDKLIHKVQGMKEETKEMNAKII